MEAQSKFNLRSPRPSSRAPKLQPNNNNRTNQFVCALFLAMETNAIVDAIASNSSSHCEMRFKTFTCDLHIRRYHYLTLGRRARVITPLNAAVRPPPEAGDTAVARCAWGSRRVVSLLLLALGSPKPRHRSRIRQAHSDTVCVALVGADWALVRRPCAALAPPPNLSVT